MRPTPLILELASPRGLPDGAASAAQRESAPGYPHPPQVRRDRRRDGPADRVYRFRQPVEQLAVQTTTRRIRRRSTKALRTSWRCSRCFRSARSSSTRSSNAVGLPDTRRRCGSRDLTIDALQEGVLLGLGRAVRRSALGRPRRGAAAIGEAQAVEGRSRHTGSTSRSTPARRAARRLDAARVPRRSYRDSPGDARTRHPNGRLPAERVAEEGADIADRLLTMSIRALDYMPPTDIELRRLHQRAAHVRSRDTAGRLAVSSCGSICCDGFAGFGFVPSSSYGGTRPAGGGRRLEPLNYSLRASRGAAARPRRGLPLHLGQSRRSRGCATRRTPKSARVRPCLRVDVDGFTLRETVADYVQILTVRADELETIRIPDSQQTHSPARRAGRLADGPDSRRRRARSSTSSATSSITCGTRCSIRIASRRGSRYLATIRLLRSRHARRARVCRAAHEGHAPVAAVGDEGETSMAVEPERLTIRCYGVGFGDCFLLTSTTPARPAIATC